MLLAHTDVGTLNQVSWVRMHAHTQAGGVQMRQHALLYLQVVELWRYRSTGACMR